MQNIRKKGKVFTLGILFLVCMLSLNVSAASSFKYKYNGKKITYKGIQPTIKYNNKKISLSSTPAILVNDIAMVPYYETLVKNGPKMKKSYTSKTKTLVLTHNGNTMKMTVGKKTAYVNNKKITLPVAPMMITYISSNKKRILVPSRKVCEYMGLSYSWNSSSSVVSIESKTTMPDGLSIKYDGSYHTYTGTQASIYVNNVKVNTEMPGVKIDETWYIPANATCNSKYKLGVSYSYKSKKVTLTDGTDKVVITADSKTTVINGSTKTMPDKCRRIYLKKNKTTYVTVPLAYFCSLFDLTYNVSGNKITLKSAEKKYPANIPETSYTKYLDQSGKNISFADYANQEYGQLSASYKKTITLAGLKVYMKKSQDTTDGFKYLRLDTYRDMNVNALDELISNNAKGKKGILNGQGSAINTAAKKYNIDPVAFAMQCIHETGWGTSTLAMGITSNEVAVPIYNSKKEVTGFEVETDEKGNKKKDKNGNYVYKTVKLSKKVTAYNLFGIKAYDSAANLCGFSYAYYNGWTTIPKAIEGGAKYISDNYIHNSTYEQNTFYKFRFNPKVTNLWHQYATDPGYAEKNGVYLKNYKYLYKSTATFQYDYPEFLQ